MKDRKGREVFDLDVSGKISVVLDIEPDEGAVGLRRSQRFECFAKLLACAAPSGAKADNEKFTLFKRAAQARGVFSRGGKQV